MGIVVGVGVVLAIGAVILYKRRERSQSADSNGSNDSFTYKWTNLLMKLLLLTLHIQL